MDILEWAKKEVISIHAPRVGSDITQIFEISG